MKSTFLILNYLLSVFIIFKPFEVLSQEVDISIIKHQAIHGDADAQFNLGYCYYVGLGLNVDSKEAKAWFQRSIENGKKLEKKDLNNINSLFKLLEKLAKGGNSFSQNLIGVCYIKSLGTTLNYQEALKWFNKSSKKGDRAAKFNIGLCFELGLGVDKDNTKAYNWYKEAAQLGYINSMIKIGDFFENGKCVEKNFDTAKYWYNKAKNLDASNPYLQNKIQELNFKVTKITDLNYFDKVDYSSFTLDEIKNLILTWSEFYNLKAKCKLTYTLDDIETNIKKSIEKWQIKGEFEPTQEWQERVNNVTRNNKINELKEQYLKKYKNEIYLINKEQKSLADSYSHYFNDIINKYYEQKMIKEKNSFLRDGFILKPYDADNQTFLIKNNKYGDLLLPVPINKAESFKKNWISIRKKIEPEFIPNGNEMVLVKLIFHNNEDTYIYDKNTQGNYNTISIDYNFAPIEFADLDIKDIKINNLSELNIIDYKSDENNKISQSSIYLKNIEPSKNEITASTRSNVDYEIPIQNIIKNSSTFAIIIGNEYYHNVSKVPYAQKDVKILEKYLVCSVGIPEENIRIYENASYGNIAAALKYIENLSEAFGENINLIFYYAGHGIPNEKTKQAMLLPVDGDVSIPETCYDLSKLYSQLGNLKANSILVLIDACFSGSLRGEGMLMTARGIKIKSDMATPKGNMIILTAAQGDETAFPYEKEEHGMFTYFLLKKLQEKKGNVTLGELSDYIIEKVKQQSLVTNGKLQTPSISVSPQLEDKWRNLKFGN